MKRCRPNPRLAKIHRSYAVDELARLLGIHRKTVREWIKVGLPTIDDRRPMLIQGTAVRDFLSNRRARDKRPCGPGQLYCLRCRVPREPSENRAEYRPLSPTQGNLVAACRECGTSMYRRVNLLKLGLVSGDLDVASPVALSRISDSP